MVLLTTAAIVDAALGLALDKSAGGVLGAAGRRLRKRSARSELASIVEAAVEHAARHAPLLASGLRERSFVERMVTPVVLDVVANPTRLPDADSVAAAILCALAAAEGEPVHAGPDLRRALTNDSAALTAVLRVLAEALRDGFNGSEAWKDVAHRQVTEAIGKNVVEILGLQRRAASPPLAVAASAREDAATGSGELRDWPRDIWGSQIERPEFGTLTDRILSKPSGATIVVGEAGTGKSALLSALVEALEKAGTPVFGIKADRLPADVRTLADVSQALGMRGGIAESLRTLAAAAPSVLLIDQLDAVSDVMDRSSERMRLLLQLVEEVHPRGRPSDRLPVHVVISSRPFEADHDARFGRLDAERMTLRLPSREKVEQVLAELDIDPAVVPDAIAETVRRPFALKLFVDLVKRGAAVDDLLPSRLLARWLETANLGDAGARAEVIALLMSLAGDMVRTETLWRPTDILELERPDALRRAVASGLLIIRDGRVGFSHQSWLDDFQAKGLSDADTLKAFARRTQDGLFTRGSVLRALQRMRSFDPGQYEAAVDALLGEEVTRRHLRHLVVDLLAGQPSPYPREAGWIGHLLRTDPALARRAIPLVAARWEGWRAHAGGWLPMIMRDRRMDGVAELLLAAEMRVDVDAALGLIERHWPDAGHAPLVLTTLERSRVWNVRTAALLASVVRRSHIAPHFVSHLGSELVKSGRSVDAVDLTATYLVASLERGSVWDEEIYGLETVVGADPLLFAQRVLPAFVDLAKRNSAMPEPGSAEYADSPHLDWRWRRREQGSPFQALRLALRLCAERTPEKLRKLLEPHFAVEVEAVQTVLADALAAGGSALANEGLAFLLSDPRRIDVGESHGQGVDGIGRTVRAWSSRQLVRAVAPGLDGHDLQRLVDAIERWSPPQFTGETDAAFRRRLRRWAEEARMDLLSELPRGALTPRRWRQVAEWRATQPVFRGEMDTLHMANYVGSPMSAKSMALASDDHIVAMMEARHDGADERHERRRPFTGGARQLAQAFGAFAKEQPERALAIVSTRLVSGRHESVAGAGLRELAGVEEVDPETVADLIQRLARAGFTSASFRNDAGWALNTVAGRRNGLREEDVALLEGWIEDDADAVARRLERRAESAAESQRLNRRPERETPRPLLFGSGGGHVVVPQGNFTFVDAIGQGLLLRPEPDVVAFTGVLMRHTARAEDPVVWAHTLLSYGQVLWSMPEDDASELLMKLLEHHPQALDDPHLVRVLWQVRRRVPEDVIHGVLERWTAGESKLRQAAGELVAGLAIVHGDEDPQARRAAPMLADGTPAEKAGFAFSAVAAWTDGDPGLRERAHGRLVSLAADAADDVAAAVATCFSRSSGPPPDERTRELLQKIAANPIALEAALGHWLLDALSALLVHPGFDRLVLDTLAAAVKLRNGASASLGARSFGLGDDMVRIAVALQRTDGPIRTRAMDVYERLLDANAYGAAQAAEASLLRNG